MPRKRASRVVTREALDRLQITAAPIDRSAPSWYDCTITLGSSDFGSRGRLEQRARIGGADAALEFDGRLARAAADMPLPLASAAASSSSAHSTRLRDRPIFRSSVSTRRIFTSISSPTLTTSSRVLDLLVGEFRDVQQAFEAVFQADEDAEVGDLRDLALHELAGLVAVRDVGRPRIFVELLQAQGDAAAFLVDRQHLALDLLALLEHFARVADLAGPRHVADVQQAVDAFFDLDEGAVVGEVANLALDDAAGRVLVGDLVPRIRLGLLHAERDFLLLLVDAAGRPRRSRRRC